ncbi:olfactory receptor 8B4 [Artibeus jamaicensis]|uniref:olfactory receptor 8B4 n=1 Tax=Artibeus jamaicensis TaxID=9417 RepID=UPI00235AEE85|nr:olfactory receptor 8B4 [Artibeus jamaicensis]
MLLLIISQCTFPLFLQGTPQKRMTLRNSSSVTGFIFVGFSEQSELCVLLFLLLLGIYVFTMVGNLGLVTLIGLNSSLHTPMYFFLFNLSFIDLCYSCVFTPKMLSDFVSENVISFVGCMTQLFFFCFFVNSECYVLVAMAYDRYVAICKPLLYTVTMSPQVCALLMFSSYMAGFMGAMAHTGSMLRLSFCDSNVIDHYLCEVLPLLQLSCTSTWSNQLVFFVVVGAVITTSSSSIFVSYALILRSILRIPSAEGRAKAFSTCSSHILAVALFFGSGAFTYLTTSLPGPVHQSKYASIFYTNVVPMLNPLIYSLRNKDVKLALGKTLRKVLF